MNEQSDGYKHAVLCCKYWRSCKQDVMQKVLWRGRIATPCQYGASQEPVSRNYEIPQTGDSEEI